MIYHDILPERYIDEAGAIMYDALIDKFTFSNMPRKTGIILFARF